MAAHSLPFFFFFFFFIPTLSLLSLSTSNPLLLPLTHSLSNSKFTTIHHLLKSTSTHSTSRFLHHHHHPRPQTSLPLSPGTDYTLSLSLGSTTISLYLDTGSDLVWLPCSPFQCILCEGKPNPLPLNLSSTSASAVTCQSPACSAAHSHLPTSDLCASARCPLESIELSECNPFSCPHFYYAYGDGSLIGKLYSDDLIVPNSNPSLILPNFTFGCSHSSLGEPIGVAGFGRGLLSLPAQLSTNRFSYCLVSHSFDPTRVRKQSPLILGRSDEKTETQLAGNVPGGEFAYTPMLENPKHPYFYCVGLEAVTVGTRRIPAPASLTRVDGSGNGGMVVDSGTTYTMLPEKLYKSVVAEFNNRVGSVYKRAGLVEDRTGLGPCYYVNRSNAIVPKLVLHFGGNSSVVMPMRNYFYEFLDGGDNGKGEKRKVGCMMLMNGGYFPESSGPTGLLGNYQQQGLEVVYDLEKRRVGFARRMCASLWDSLNRN